VEDLKNRDTHFEFGENWRSFVSTVNDARIQEAVNGMAKLFPSGELEGKRFLDIGCGSGIHMLAALRLGVKEAVGFDVDENSVTAARVLLTRYAPDMKWRVEHRSVFDLDPAQVGQFEVVYSWGVLHHTGDMWTAVAKAMNLVEPGGLFALALYYKTRLCGLWNVEKRVYSRAPKFIQVILRWFYQVGFVFGMIGRGWNPIAYIRDFYKKRGMSWTHDVHDWLGGYPYESATADEVEERLKLRGFESVRMFGPREMRLGLHGSGCNEYVFQQATAGR
jgi:2-polyprenyl-6-hydroxyphenyl methylase/3-demethylubiquinone-9 3-methyltransferase